VHNGEEMARAVLEFFEDHSGGGSSGAAAREAIRSRLGAADRAAELVASLWSTERKDQD
jgi:hypothetical protein